MLVKVRQLCISHYFIRCNYHFKKFYQFDSGVLLQFSANALMKYVFVKIQNILIA